MAKKVIETKRYGFRLVWRNGERGMIDVDVYRDGFPDATPIIEWSYPKIAGNSLVGNIAVWEEQAILETKRTLQNA